MSVVAGSIGRARGVNFPVSELTEFTRQRGYIRDKAHPNQVTLREVLMREWEIVQTARDGVAAMHLLVRHPHPINPKLNDEQRTAIKALLGSTNTVSVFRGGAGTGKSFVLHELVDQVQQSGRRVVVLAPQRQQVVGMEQAGFPSPTTFASFLIKRELVAGSVVVVDEAEQIGGRQMLDLMRLVRERNARLILSGDTRQHGAVEASDALLAIERHSGVKPVELHKIRRQDPALARDENERTHIRQYRKAVESAAAGKMSESFEHLDKMGAVVECGLGEQTDKLAAEYGRLAEQNAAAVVVSQTWAEVHRVNSSVRDGLKGKGLLGAADTVVQALDKLDLTNAQKRDKRFYPPEAIVVFNQKVRAAQPGAKGKLAGIVKAGVLIEVGGKFVTVPNKLLDRITLCQTREINLASGDRLQLKANRKLVSGMRVTNGEVVTIKSVKFDGDIELADGRVLDKSYREFLPGYAVTSYGSQGKTVDYVLFSDSTVKAATIAGTFVEVKRCSTFRHGVAEAVLVVGVWQPVRVATMPMVNNVASKEPSFILIVFWKIKVESLCHRQKSFAKWSQNLDRLSRLSEPSRVRINTENNRIAAVLIADQQPATCRIELAIARCFALGGNVLQQSQPSRIRIHRKHGHAVISPVGGVNKFAVGMHQNFRSIVFSLEIFRERGNRFVLRQAAGFGVPTETYDGIAHLVDQINVAAIGMKRRMTRSRTGRHGGGRRIAWLQRAGLWVQLINQQFVQPQVSGQNVAIARIDTDRVGVRVNSFAGNVVSARVLHIRGALADATVRLQRKHRDAAALKIGDHQKMASGIEADIAGIAAIAGFLINEG